MSLDNEWFSEAMADQGLAFSLQVRRKLHEERTPYQLIEVYETTHWGNLMVIDGAIMVTGKDNFLYHEMMSHPVLFTHPDPRRVLIIGGGDCGMLREVLRHPGVERATQVDIDEGVTRASQLYFPELCESNSDPRADLRFEDGVKYIRNVPAGSVDVVIVDSTDPVGPAVGLFKPNFFREVRRALAPDGLLCQQSESPLLHLDSILKELHDNMRSAGFDRVATLQYPMPSYPAGWWSATIAGRGKPLNVFRESDAASRPFETRYYNPAMHKAALAVPAFCAGVFVDQ